MAAPLTAETAVQVAFFNNPSLQATFEEVGVSQADLAQAARVENPELSGFVRFPSEGSGRNTELSLVQNVFDIFQILIEMQAEVALDVTDNHPQLAQKKEFTDFKRHTEILKGLLAEKKLNMDALMNLFAYEEKATQAAHAAVTGEKIATMGTSRMWLASSSRIAMR